MYHVICKTLSSFYYVKLNTQILTVGFLFLDRQCKDFQRHVLCQCQNTKHSKTSRPILWRCRWFCDNHKVEVIDWSVCLLTLKHLVSLPSRIRSNVADTKSYAQPYDWEHSTKSYGCTSFMTRAFIVTTRDVKRGRDISGSSSTVHRIMRCTVWDDRRLYYCD